MSPVFESLWAEFEPVVQSVAAQYGRSNYQYGADREDFTHEAVVWMLDNEARLSEKYDELGPEEFSKYLARCLRNESTDYSIDIKAQALGYHRDDLVFYGRNELKVLLPAMFDEESWLNPPQSEGRTTKALHEGGGWIATLADLSRAYANLTEADQILLRKFHEQGMPNHEMADEYGIGEAAMSSRHSTALGRLLRHLGDEKPKPMRDGNAKDPWRGRKALTNASARAVTSSNYDE